MAFAGARNPEGKGRIPNITPSHEGIGGWSEDEIVEFLTTGSTPEFDVVGGLMAPVQETLAKLTPQDRAAIAAYLKSLPPRADAVPKRKSGQGGDTDEDDDEAPDAEPDTGATTE
jgi:hypothetical protein